MKRARPLDDLRVHRGQLHAVRTAGAAANTAAWCCSGSSGAARSPAWLLKMFWPSAPRWVGVPLYLLLGWVAVWFIGPIMHGAGVAAVVLLIVGGALYSIGGVLYGVEVAQPVADDVRPPRVLPRLHRGGGDLPLHRDVVRRLLGCPLRERARSATCAACHWHDAHDRATEAVEVGG